MGLGISTDDREQYQTAIGARLYDAMHHADALPDVGIDWALLENADLPPQVVLQDSFKRLKKHVDARGPAYLKELMGRLAVFTEEPQVIGLLTLVISMVMETAYASSRKSPQGALVDGKVSELRDLVDEYLKRCRMYESATAELRQDTWRLEAQLSFQLTQIKGAMLREGPASSWALKHWANGAVLHAQMLLRLAVMDGRSTEAARAALLTYQDDLQELLAAYRRYKASTVHITKHWAGQPSGDSPPDDGTVTGYTIRDRELGRSADVPVPEGGLPAGAFVSTEACVEAYLEHLFSHYAPIAGMQRRFSEVLTHLQKAPPPGSGGQPA